MIVPRAEDLRYAVFEHNRKNELHCRARFADVEEADWYAKNIYRASSKSQAYIVVRIIDIKDRDELVVLGSLTNLETNEVNVACTMVAA